MSAIDQYQHRRLGFIECPSTFDFTLNNPTRRLAIYELLETIPPDETEFDGKVGDIILGGGRGEAPAFRISMPEAVCFFTKDDWDDFDTYDDLFKAFWTPTQAYNLCQGFLKYDWTPDTPIEFWLAKQVCLLLMTNVDHYSTYKINNTVASSVLPFIKLL